MAFDVTEDGEGYVWKEAEFPPGRPLYADLVSAFIRGRYSDDGMQAVINNHLLGDGDESHEAEWEAMQEWRTEAKALARAVLEEIG